MQFLFYRQEARENSGERAAYDIKIEIRHEKTTTSDDYEMILNQAQVDSNAILRCIITYEDSYQKMNFVVFQEKFTEDRLYMLSDFKKFPIVTEKTITDLNSSRSNSSARTDAT